MAKAGASIPMVQKYGAVFGLLGSLIVLGNLVMHFVSVQGLASLAPEDIVRWTKEHQFLLFVYPLLILAMMFFALLVQGIEDRLRRRSPHLALLSGRFGWFIVLLFTLMLLADWFHVYANAVVWEEEIAQQYVRVTFNTVTFFSEAISPFFAGWLVATGIGGIRSRGFSRAFSWVCLIMGFAVALDFFGHRWEPFFSIPLLGYLGYLSPYYFMILIWASLELLFRKDEPGQSENR